MEEEKFQLPVDVRGSKTSVLKLSIIRELKKTTTTTATKTSRNNRFNEQNNGCTRAL